MPSQFEAISFAPNQDSSSEELGGASPYALNVIVDGNGVVSKRPGIKAYSVAPSGVIDSTGIAGLYAANDGQLFAVNNAVNSRHIYKIANGSATQVDHLPDETLIGNGRPIFAETEVYLIIAGGLNIQKVKLSNLESSRLGGDPPLATHVVANSSRLLANDSFVDKTKVRFSGVFQGTVDTSEMEDWTVDGNPDHGGFFTAEARPDNILAIADNTNEIFVWGTDNLQVFVPDTNLIFAPAATREIGTCAPYSIIKKDQEFFWLDQYRRIVYSDGRSFQNIDKPIKNQLEALSNPSDCFAFRMILGNKECFVWSFIQDQVSYVYQVDSGWAIWSSYDSANANFSRLNILSHHLRRDGGVNVVGTYDGRVGFLDPNTPDDLGEKIVASVATGFLDRGSDNRKFCKSVKISGRRGSTSTQSLGRLEWRDSTGPWNGPLYFDFGSTGDYDIVKEFRSLGTYNRRQWKFSFSDSANLSLVRVQEEFEVLGV
jgi:hypothetical protein